jgi:hypothetical protein
MGFDDDFSYIWTARAMAATGHFVYNRWSTAMLGWQIYLGAFFIKLLGFSFTTVRASVLLLGMATAALLQRVFVRVGVNEWNATLATLTLTVSPLFLPLTFSFMSDIPGFLAILVCLYGCIRAVQASSDRAAIRWLILAALSNAIGGTARQIAWLGVLVLVPSTAWVIRRRRGVLVVAAALWVISAAFIAGCMHWFKAQPYSVSEPLIAGIHYRSHKYQAILLFSLPILIAFVARYPVRERWARIQAGAAVVAMVAVGGICAAMWHGIPESLLAPFSDSEVTAKGLEIGGMFGHRPDVLPMAVRIALTLLTFSAFFALLILIVNASRLEKLPHAGNAGQISNRALVEILGPFTAAYLLLSVTRAAVFERYFLPLLLVFLIFLLRFYQARIASRLPPLTAVFVILLGAYGVVAFHDLMATDRAQLDAADELRAAGVPRSEIRAGIEYDGWTQIELTGHLAPKPPWHEPPPCVFWWDSDTPAIQGRYRLSYSPSSCFPESEFPPFHYTTWLPPRHQQIYILKLLK